MKNNKIKYFALGSIGIGLILFFLGKKLKPRQNKNITFLENQNDFIQAANEAKKLKNLSQMEQLQIYALYKQATLGDCNTQKPLSLDIINVAKWEAWSSLRGLSKEQAEFGYIQLIQTLDPNLVINQKKKPTGMGGFGQRVSTIKSTDKDNNDAFIKKFNIQADTFKETELSVQDESKVNQLHNLIKKGNAEQFKKEFSTIQNVQSALEHMNQQGISLIHQAVDQSQIEIFDQLIGLYEDHKLINIQDQVGGMTPLHYAVQVENEEIIQKLIAAGANPKQLDFTNESPLDGCPEAFLKYMM